MSAIDIIIQENGTIQAIYNDALVPLIEAGQSVTKRASRVEPAEDGTWTVDMSPVGGPTFGGFRTRAEALAAEVQWLKDHREL